MDSSQLQIKECLKTKQTRFWCPYADDRGRELGGAVLTSFMAAAFKLTDPEVQRLEALELQEATEGGQQNVVLLQRVPKPIARRAFLEAIVRKEWQPEGDENNFDVWNAPLSPSGQIVVVFAALVFRWEAEEIREHLAGLAFGLQSIQSASSHQGVPMTNPVSQLITLDQIANELTDDERHSGVPAPDSKAYRLAEKRASQLSEEAPAVFQEALPRRTEIDDQADEESFDRSLPGIDE